MSTCDHYELLGIEQNADRQTIRAAYRRALRRYHPDANAGSRDGEQALLQVITAGRTLCDPGKRDDYDRLLGKDRPPQPLQKPRTKTKICRVDRQKILLSWHSILRAVNLFCQRFFNAELASQTEARVKQQPQRPPPNFSLFLKQATNRNSLHRYQRGRDGVYRKVSRQPRHEKLRTWQKKTVLWIVIGLMM